MQIFIIMLFGWEKDCLIWYILLCLLIWTNFSRILISNFILSSWLLQYNKLIRNKRVRISTYIDVFFTVYCNNSKWVLTCARNFSFPTVQCVICEYRLLIAFQIFSGCYRTMFVTELTVAVVPLQQQKQRPLSAFQNVLHNNVHM